MAALQDKSISIRDEAILARLKPLANWEARYQEIIKAGKSLVPLAESEKSEDLKIRGCQSQVWLKATYENGIIKFKADSDALIVKGLVSLLVELYSDSKPEEIINYKPRFISELGLNSHLSPSRANGLFAMIKQIQFYAIAFKSLK